MGDLHIYRCAAYLEEGEVEEGELEVEGGGGIAERESRVADRL